MTQLRPASRGVTLLEALLSLGAAVTALCVIVPLAAAGRSRSLAAASLANLAKLNQAHAAYAASWNDRQWTMIPDDFSAGGGTYQGYVNYCGCCPASTGVGYGCSYPSGGSCGNWGYWLPCSGSGGVPGNIVANTPFHFGGPAGSPADAGFGSWRLPNASAFNSYVGGRFYDPVFYAPSDMKAQQFIGPGLESPNPFTLLSIQDSLIYSSYALSPAAMYHPTVMGAADAAFHAPWQLPDGYKSPSNSECAHPDLKTRMLEHDWLQNPPAPGNPNFAGTKPPYFFNQGFDSVPMTLFYDGHTTGTSVRKVIADNDAAQAAGGSSASLWITNITVGPWVGYGGYYTITNFDQANTSFHVFTRNGILGRDILAP